MYDCFVDTKGAIYNPCMFGISASDFGNLEPNRWYPCGDGTKVRIGNFNKEQERMTREIKNANA